jgi:hypothetical protein
MSYPPKEYGDPDDPLLTGQSSTGGASEEIEGKEEEELNAVRRYEDFTTVGTYSLKKHAISGADDRLDTG